MTPTTAPLSADDGAAVLAAADRLFLGIANEVKCHADRVVVLAAPALFLAHGHAIPPRGDLACVILDEAAFLDLIQPTGRAACAEVLHLERDLAGPGGFVAAHVGTARTSFQAYKAALGLGSSTLDLDRARTPAPGSA